MCLLYVAFTWSQLTTDSKDPLQVLHCIHTVTQYGNQLTCLAKFKNTTSFLSLYPYLFVPFVFRMKSTATLRFNPLHFRLPFGACSSWCDAYHIATFYHLSFTATWHWSLRHFRSVLMYLTFLQLSTLISCDGCLCFPVPGSMAVLMNSSAISRSSPVYVQATSSSVTGLCLSTSFKVLLRFLFFVPRRPLWTVSPSWKCHTPSCKHYFWQLWWLTILRQHGQSNERKCKMHYKSAEVSVLAQNMVSIPINVTYSS